MKHEEQVEWFRKWQDLDVKRRWQLVGYVEQCIEAQEVVDDDIIRWMTFDMYRMDQHVLGEKDEKAILASWQSLIESMQQRIRKHGEWFVPKVMGSVRRYRHRVSEEITTMRQANVANAEELILSGGAFAICWLTVRLRFPSMTWCCQHYSPLFQALEGCLVSWLYA